MQQQIIKSTLGHCETLVTPYLVKRPEVADSCGEDKLM